MVILYDSFSKQTDYNNECRIGGESAWDIKDRLDYDVFDRKPTYVTLTFGMNDTGYDIFWKENAKELSEQRIEKSLESFREIEKRLLAENKMTKVLIGGSPMMKLRN